MKYHSDSSKYFSDTGIIVMIDVLIDNTFVIFVGRFLANAWHSHGHMLCSSSRKLLLLLIWGRFLSGASKKRKEANPMLYFHVPLYRWCGVLSLNYSKFGDYVGLIYQIELEKWIPQLQIDLRYTLTYISKIFFLYVAISQQHLDMEYISPSWYVIIVLVFLDRG